MREGVRYVHLCMCAGVHLQVHVSVCACGIERERDFHYIVPPPPPPPGQCQAADMYVEQLRDTIRHSVPKGRLAAFFAETIQVSKLNNFLIGFVKCKLSRLP